MPYTCLFACSNALACKYSLAQTWLARAGFYHFSSSSIATTALYSGQLAPGQANTPLLQYPVNGYVSIEFLVLIVLKPYELNEHNKPNKH